MNRRAWLALTACTVLLTGFVLNQTGFPCTRRNGHAFPRHLELHRHAPGADPLESAAVARWGSGAPTHWRACLIQQ